jgi:hypothetical protein
MEHASRCPNTGRSIRIQAVSFSTCLAIASTATDDFASRRLPGRCGTPDHMGYILLKCGHRYLPHHGTATYALGNAPETHQEGCRYLCVWRRHICPCLLASKDRLRYNGKLCWSYWNPAESISPR